MCKRILLYGTAAALGVFAALVFTSVFTVMTVRGSGMEPAFEDGDKILINKLAYASFDVKNADSDAKSALLQTGDVVAFRSDVYGEEGEGSVLVRRVAGKSGDTVEIKDDIFYLNSKPYDKYMKEPVAMDDMQKITLKKDEIFVLSDNRKSSMDSRNEAIGVLKIDDCIGKVCFE